MKIFEIEGEKFTENLKDEILKKFPVNLRQQMSHYCLDLVLISRNSRFSVCRNIPQLSIFFGRGRPNSKTVGMSKDALFLWRPGFCARYTAVPILTQIQVLALSRLIMSD